MVEESTPLGDASGVPSLVPQKSTKAVSRKTVSLEAVGASKRRVKRMGVTTSCIFSTGLFSFFKYLFKLKLLFGAGCSNSEALDEQA